MPAHDQQDARNAISRKKAGTADSNDEEIVEEWSHLTGEIGDLAREALKESGKPRVRGFFETLL